MAKREYKKITKKEFDKVLQDHKLWIDSDFKQGLKANLSEIDLTPFYLSGSDLRGAILTEV